MLSSSNAFALVFPAITRVIAASGRRKCAGRYFLAIVFPG
ncbi:hypothetical protein SALB1_0879 [Salinisphaera sp. LB1]|nr:hypothetical protein SALB1_0879 [Salinisphaera sp. LB1]